MQVDEHSARLAALGSIPHDAAAEKEAEFKVNDKRAFNRKHSSVSVSVVSMPVR